MVTLQPGGHDLLQPTEAVRGERGAFEAEDSQLPEGSQVLHSRVLEAGVLKRQLLEIREAREVLEAHARDPRGAAIEPEVAQLREPPEMDEPVIREAIPLHRETLKPGQLREAREPGIADAGIAQVEVAEPP